MRAIGLVFFLLVICVIGWVAVTGGVLDGPGGGQGGSELSVAEEAVGEVRDLDAVVEDALGNARRARALADELTEASADARDAVAALAGLADDNEAARLSAEATAMAADDAEEAAMLMRRYADTLLGRFEDVGAMMGEAEAVADMAVEVEETQAEAAAAAAEARAAMTRAEDVADELDPSGDSEAFGGAGPPYGGEIVIIDERGERDERGGRGAAGTQERLDEIFPDDVLDYGDEDYVPYGERG